MIVDGGPLNLQGSSSSNKPDGDEIAVTDNGNYIVDLFFEEPIKDVAAAAAELKNTVGYAAGWLCSCQPVHCMTRSSPPKSGVRSPAFASLQCGGSRTVLQHDHGCNRCRFRWRARCWRGWGGRVVVDNMLLQCRPLSKGVPYL